MSCVSIYEQNTFLFLMELNAYLLLQCCTFPSVVSSVYVKSVVCSVLYRVDGGCVLLFSV
jgi:hypothetical protein